MKLCIINTGINCRNPAATPPRRKYMKILCEIEITIASIGDKGVKGRSRLGWVFVPARLLTEKVDKDYVLVVKALPSDGASRYVATEVA
jgi:hypothetical protein